MAHEIVDPDLSAFEEVNARPGKKMTWDERVEVIFRQFPAIRDLDWKKAFDRDMDLFAWIMQDVFKSDAAAPGRSGPKPHVEYSSESMARFRQMMGEDYSMYPFHEAFQILAGTRSLSALAVKTGISRSQVRRLLRGEVEPSSYEMECVARGFRKSPGYFLEYRRGVVLAAIAHRLTEVPEASVKYFQKIKQAA